VDPITFFVIAAALIGGGAVGYTLATRRVTPEQALIRATGQHALLPASRSTNLLTSLGDPMDERIVMQRAAEWLQAEIGVAVVLIYPYDSASQELVNPVIIGVANPVDITTRWRIGAGYYGEVASQRETRLIENVSRDPRFTAAAATIESAYLLPLITEGRLLGVASLQSENPNFFTLEKRSEIDQYCGVVAIQSMIARRFTDSRHAIERFDRFQQLSQTLVTQLDTQDLLQPIVNAARDMLDTQMSVLMELRPNDDRLHPVSWSGITDDTAMLLKSHLKDDLKGMVAWARLPARTPNLRTDQRTARASEAVVAGMLSELAAPVMYADKLYGVLAVETNVYRNFTDEESFLLQSLAAQAGIALRNAQLYSRVRNTNQQLEVTLTELQKSQMELQEAHEAQIHAYEHELQTARDIQTSLLPEELPPIPRVQVAARNIPARHVSGDFYQYFLLPGGKLGVAIGDVCGKGIPAALLMAVTTTALRDEIFQSQTAVDTLNELNYRLLDRMQQNNMNSALAIAVIDSESGLTEIANAGMVMPYYRSPQSDEWEQVEVGGYPLGAASRSRYRGRNIILSGGASLVMVSDGVIECANPDGEFYGFERFETLINSLAKDLTPEQMIEKILESVTTFAAGEDFQDDVTVVVTRVA
jgi:serine phosphatase RsbU (regulator of sigma subunit)